MTSNRRADAAYWLFAAILFTAQAAFTRAGLERLWYEELAEGIRNPFWLDHRLVYDGVSGNVGWYGLVLIVYKVLGFSPYAAKYVRLALHVPFLACSALLLKRWLGTARAWLPLAAIGLSPTLLYFNNLGTSYGTDVELFPVVLFLVSSVGELAGRSRAAALWLSASAGGLTMLACLIYPSFLFYVPVLLCFFLWSNRSALMAASTLEAVGAMGVGVAVPFAAAFAYLSNRSVWLFDPVVRGAGVFRGGGYALTADRQTIVRTVSDILGDLFFHGRTYYFALPRPDFSGTIGLAAAVGVALGSVVLAWKWKPIAVPLTLAGTLCVLSIGVVAFTGNLPGIRRSTGALSGFYVAVACVWAVPRLHGTLNRLLACAAKAACVLLVAHHAFVYVTNYRFISRETGQVHDEWFYRFGGPTESVRRWTQDWVQQDRPLRCLAPSPCRYSEIYSAVAGSLRWDRIGERPIYAIDPQSGRRLELTPWVWETRALPH